MSTDVDDDVVPNIHAAIRWHQRAGDDPIYPVQAWREGCEMSLPEPHYRNADEGRYHRPTNTVLLRQGTDITTTLSMDPQDIDSEQGEALKEAVEAQFGEIGDSDMRFTEADS